MSHELFKQLDNRKIRRFQKKLKLQFFCNLRLIRFLNFKKLPETYSYMRVASAHPPTRSFYALPTSSSYPWLDQNATWHWNWKRIKMLIIVQTSRKLNLAYLPFCSEKQFPILIPQHFSTLLHLIRNSSMRWIRSREEDSSRISAEARSPLT